MNLRALAPVHVSEHAHMSETSHYMHLYIGVYTLPPLHASTPTRDGTQRHTSQLYVNSEDGLTSR